MNCSICDNPLPRNARTYCDDCIQLLVDLEDLGVELGAGRPVKEHRAALVRYHAERVEAEEPRELQRKLAFVEWM